MAVLRDWTRFAFSIIITDHQLKLLPALTEVILSPPLPPSFIYHPPKCHIQIIETSERKGTSSSNYSLLCGIPTRTSYSIESFGMHSFHAFSRFKLRKKRRQFHNDGLKSPQHVLFVHTCGQFFSEYHWISWWWFCGSTSAVSFCGAVSENGLEFGSLPLNGMHYSFKG